MWYSGKRIEKLKVLMDIITVNDWELRLSTRSLEFFKSTSG